MGKRGEISGNENRERKEGENLEGTDNGLAINWNHMHKFTTTWHYDQSRCVGQFCVIDLFENGEL
jgi:hypothetical protein